MMGIPAIPVLVKLVCYTGRPNIFRIKKSLKDKNISIIESLAKETMIKLTEANMVLSKCCTLMEIFHLKKMNFPSIKHKT